MTTTGSLARNQDAYDRFDSVVEGPMTFVALAMVPLLLIPLVHPLHGSADEAVNLTDYVIWGLFTVEYAIKLYLTPNRLAWARTPGHLFDLAIVVLPFLRPLRVVRSARGLRTLRATRALTFVGAGLHHLRAILRKRGLSYVLLVALAVVFVAAALETAVEAHTKGATIHNFGDALWWAMTTVTTVGYGDKVPVSPTGRGVAVVLMLVGIAVFGTVTASVAAYFVQNDKDDQMEEVVAALNEIKAHLGIGEASNGQGVLSGRAVPVEAEESPRLTP